MQLRCADGSAVCMLWLSGSFTVYSAAVTRCELQNTAAAVFLLVESRADVDLEGLQLFLKVSHTPVLRQLIGKMVRTLSVDILAEIEIR